MSLSPHNLLTSLKQFSEKKQRLFPYTGLTWEGAGGGSVVGMTGNRLDGSGFELRQGQEIFSSPHPSRPTLGPTKPPVQ
jgi:hypothetical protein